jgi:dTMP kinase
MGEGLFVAVEGIDGSGKTTLAGSLVRQFAGLGWRVTGRREPSSGPIGTLFRRLSAGVELSPLTAALLSAADRQDQQPMLREQLTDADLVVSDRYYLSGLAYHRADGIPEVFYRSLNRGIREPDLYLFLDVDLGTARIRRDRPHGRWEQANLAAKVPGAYDACLTQLARTCGIAVMRLDATRSAHDLLDQAVAAIKSMVDQKGLTWTGKDIRS